MPKPMTSALALALTATLGFAPAAFAQSDTDASGPKRIKVPGAEETMTEEAGAEEVEAAPAEMLPEAGADGGSMVEETVEINTEEVVETEPPTEGETEGEADTAVNIFPEGDAIAEQTAEPAAEEAPEAVEVVEVVEAGTGPFVGDYTIGNAEAPVQVIEYASFTCPHCAAYHIEGWPELKAEYIDTGKIGFTLREVYFDRFGLWASMTARCGGEAAFYPMADQFLKQQKDWTGAEDIGRAIAKIGRLSGLTDDQLKECLENQEFATLLVEDYQRNATADEVRGTPHFIVRGSDGDTVINGNKADEVRAAIDEAIGGS